MGSNLVELGRIGCIILSLRCSRRYSLATQRIIRDCTQFLRLDCRGLRLDWRGLRLDCKLYDSLSVAV